MDDGHTNECMLDIKEQVLDGQAGPTALSLLLHISFRLPTKTCCNGSIIAVLEKLNSLGIVCSWSKRDL